jgi:hypothetical protein
MPRPIFWSQFATTAGDGTGGIQVTGDYSLSETHFKVQPAQDEIIEVARLIIIIGDASVAAERYGGITGGLTNGIEFSWRDVDGTVTDMLGGQKVKSNLNWARYCYDVENKDFGVGEEYITVRWTFSKSGEPIVLHGYQADRLVLSFNDDFTPLERHTFLFQGLKTAYAEGKQPSTLYPIIET